MALPQILVTILLALPLMVIAADNPRPQHSKLKNKVFKCEKDGVVTFSQLACSDDAKVVTIKNLIALRLV